ncbi:hypothetical protein VP01_520g6 [Puccinia sorghi]|uniref:Uncharacterized protein n=1 Tax=Puccinia sorghi TaxID=27349 RepID=A0A0L6UKM5_9BASI|nr:hypothetical protein VP01_520g6 [Puccinia sorghi]
MVSSKGKWTLEDFLLVRVTLRVCTIAVRNTRFQTAMKERKGNLIWTNDQKSALLITCIIGQLIAFGKWTDNVNLKAKGWNQVQKEMTECFGFGGRSQHWQGKNLLVGWKTVCGMCWQGT